MRPTRSDLRSAYDAALVAVDPRVAAARSISLEGGNLRIGEYLLDNVHASDVVVVALGKAAAAMASGVHDVLGADRGIVVTSNATDAPYPVCIGSHPIPDASSQRCGESLAAFVRGTSPTDVVLFLVSGGGSAAASLPVVGVTIEDLAVMNSVLIASGLPIEDINEIRSSVSLLKGGRLAASTRAQRQVTLVMSDIAGAGPEHVASGPSIGFGLGGRAGSLIDSRGLRDVLPSAVVAAVEDFVPADRPSAVMHTTIGSPAIAADAAAEALGSLGFDVSVDTAELAGEARREAVALMDRTPGASVLVAAGETTVTIRGGGVGGRNQEAALAVALHSTGSDVLFAALGTDGVDGPTPAAGAIVDGQTASEAKRLGIDLEGALANNDSHTVLTALGETVVTGPSGTNVADLWMAVRGRR